MSAEVLWINPELGKIAEVENKQNALNTAINSFEANPNEENFKSVANLFGELSITDLIPWSRKATDWSGIPEGEYVFWEDDRGWSLNSAVVYQKDLVNRIGILMKKGKFYTIDGTAQQMNEKVELTPSETVQYLKKLAWKSKEIYDKEIEKTKSPLEKADNTRKNTVAELRDNML